MTLIPSLSVGHPLPTKVVLRLLPPAITQKEVKDSVPEKYHDEINWTRFCAGRKEADPTPEKPNLNARMYLNFESFPVACEFIAEMHGRNYKDTSGEMLRVVAAFAPFGRVPRFRREIGRTPQDGTYEETAHFRRFIQNDEKHAIPQPVTVERVSLLVKAFADDAKVKRENAGREVRKGVEKSKRIHTSQAESAAKSGVPEIGRKEKVNAKGPVVYPVDNKMVAGGNGVENKKKKPNSSKQSSSKSEVPVRHTQAAPEIQKSVQPKTKPVKATVPKPQQPKTGTPQKKHTSGTKGENAPPPPPPAPRIFAPKLLARPAQPSPSTDIKTD